MAIFSTRPSYNWSPSRKKYVRDCGLVTTAIIPFGARTMPSRRSEETCKPALPGGRFLFASAAALSRPTRDSNGSRRATFSSAGAAPSAGPAAFLALLFGAFAAGFAAGLAAGAVVAGFAAGFVAGAGLVWANRPFPAAASSIPITSMIARCMARSFLLTVFSQAELYPLLHLLPEPYQPAS